MGDYASGEAKFRYDGYCKALQKYGIAVDPSRVIPSPFTPLEAQQACCASSGVKGEGMTRDGSTAMPYFCSALQ